MSTQEQPTRGAPDDDRRRSPPLLRRLAEQAYLEGRAYGLMVLTLRDDRVTAITGFPDTGLFRHFGLARTLAGGSR